MRYLQFPFLLGTLKNIHIFGCLQVSMFVFFKLRLVYMDSLEQLPNLRHLITEKVEKLEKLLKNGDELQSPKDVLPLLISIP